MPFIGISSDTCKLRSFSRIALPCDEQEPSEPKRTTQQGPEICSATFGEAFAGRWTDDAVAVAEALIVLLASAGEPCLCRYTTM